jgi:hypothetical protein
MQAAFAPLLTRDPNALFAATPVTIDTPTLKGQLYFNEQAADHVPFPSAPTSEGVAKHMGDHRAVLPAELVGRSNAQLAERFGLAVAGAVAPADAARPAHVDGLLGNAAEYGPERFPTVLRTGNTRGYQLVVAEHNSSAEDANGKRVKMTRAGEAADLSPGWNLLTRTIDGRPASFLVFGGADRRGGGKGYEK